MICHFLFEIEFFVCCRRSILLQFAPRRITTRALWIPSLATSLMRFRWWVLKIGSFLETDSLKVYVCVYVCNWVVHVMQIKYCTENKKRLIHFSTCEVYGKTIGSFLPEEFRKVSPHVCAPCANSYAYSCCK